VRHDIWDADLATPVTLYDAQIDGRRRKALALIRPDGYLFLLDRRNG
jgi:glucose dehydrogenase